MEGVKLLWKKPPHSQSSVGLKMWGPSEAVSQGGGLWAEEGLLEWVFSAAPPAFAGCSVGGTMDRRWPYLPCASPRAGPTLSWAEGQAAVLPVTMPCPLRG